MKDEFNDKSNNNHNSVFLKIAIILLIIRDLFFLFYLGFTNFSKKETQIKIPARVNVNTNKNSKGGG